MPKGTCFFDLPGEIREVIWRAARRQAFQDKVTIFGVKYKEITTRHRLVTGDNGRCELHLRNSDNSIHMIIVRRPAYWNRMQEYQHMYAVYKHNKKVFYTEQWNLGQSWHAVVPRYVR
jgi:hypothetical protein